MIPLDPMMEAKMKVIGDVGRLPYGIFIGIIMVAVLIFLIKKTSR